MKDSPELLPPPEAKEVIRLYLSNNWWTQKRLATKYNTTLYQIQKIFKENNIEARNLYTEREVDFCKKFLFEEKSKRLSGRELHLAAELLEKCGDKEFWDFLPMKTKLNSLAWFVSQGGKAFLNWQFKEFKKAKKIERGLDKNEDITKRGDVQLEGKNVKDLSSVGASKLRPKTIEEFIRFEK